MLSLSVGDEVVIVAGEDDGSDAGSIGEVLAISDSGPYLQASYRVRWDDGELSWETRDRVEKLIDDSASGLVDASRATGRAIHARYSRSLEKALLDREFECYAAGTCNNSRSIRLYGDDWTVVLHADEPFMYMGAAL